MNRNVFSENTRMADLILANSWLLYVLPYFGINLGLGEKTVKQVCCEKNISAPLLLLVCNLYTFDDYAPASNDLKQIQAADIIAYLLNSHKDYLENRMPKIIGEILNLVDVCNLKNGNILNSFCEKYRQEVVAHFRHEEETVFPHIMQLLGGAKAGSYKISQYQASNSNINSAIEDLKNIIIKYLPEECTIEKCRNVLLELFMFEYDMRKHSLLEDRILVSLVKFTKHTR